MGWAGRAAGAVLAALWLAAAAGCGFHPLYSGPATGTPPSSSATGTGTAAPSDAAAPSSPESSVIRDLAAVDVARIPDRPGQELRNALNDRLNPARLSEPSRFNLNIDLKQTVRQLAIDRAGLATRGNLTITARYSLTDVTTGRVVFASSARSFAGYDILAGQSTSYFSTLTSTQDARNRAVDQLANQIRARLGAFFDKHPGGTVVGAPLAGPATQIQPGFSEESDTSLDDIAPNPYAPDKSRDGMGGAPGGGGMGGGFGSEP